MYGLILFIAGAVLMGIAFSIYILKIRVGTIHFDPNNKQILLEFNKPIDELNLADKNGVWMQINIKDLSKYQSASQENETV